MHQVIHIIHMSPPFLPFHQTRPCPRCRICILVINLIIPEKNVAKSLDLRFPFRFTHRPQERHPKVTLSQQLSQQFPFFH